MTSAEMKQYFLELYDINGSQTAAGLIDSEIYSFLNKAQDDMVLEIVALKQFDRIAVLKVYEEKDLSSSTRLGLGNAYDIDSPLANVSYGYITSRSLLTRSALPVISSPQWIDNEIIDTSLVDKFDSNIYNTPIFKNPKVFFIGTVDLTVIFDAYTTPEATDSFIVEYIQKPTDIAVGVDCQLSESIHRSLVERAVKIALKITDDIRTRAGKDINLNIQ
jgi:hypothetical protein